MATFEIFGQVLGCVQHVFKLPGLSWKLHHGDLAAYALLQHLGFVMAHLTRFISSTRSGSLDFVFPLSELTLDMFRMLQTLEREPQEDLSQVYDASPATGRPPFVGDVQLILVSAKFQRAIL